METDLYLAWWQEWRTLKILPYDGELVEQPAWVVDLLQVAESTWVEAKARQQGDADERFMRSLRPKER